MIATAQQKNRNCSNIGYLALVIWTVVVSESRRTIVQIATAQIETVKIETVQIETVQIETVLNVTV